MKLKYINKNIATIKNFQKHFSFLSPLEVFFVTIGGAITSIMEMLTVTAIIPLVLIIFDPNAATNSRIVGALYRFSGLDSPNKFAVFMVLCMIGLFSIKLLLNIFVLRHEYKTLQKWRLKISSRIFDAIINAEYEKVQWRDSASLINILSLTVPYVVRNFFHSIIVIFHTILIFLFLIGFSLIYSAKTVAIASIFGFCMIYTFFLLQRARTKELGRENQELARKNFSILQMSIFGLKEIKISLKQAYFSDRFWENARRFAQKDLSLQFIQHFPGLIVEFISLSTILLAFILLLLISENVSQAAIQISVLIFVGVRLIPLINKTILAMTMISSCEEPIKSIFALYDDLTPESATPASQKMAPLPFNSTLALKNISFSYNQVENTLPALDKVSLTISKGQHVGLVGASGAGKSTIVNVILGFLTHFDGEFKIDDTIISANNIIALRKILSFVDQTPFLLNDSFMANVAYGERVEEIDHERIEACLKTVDLWEHVMASENQVETFIGENGKYLSGGQRQRLAIARALYRNAQILILDEASSALDMDSEVRLADLLFELKGKITIISIAHRLSTLKNCDKVFFVQDGRIKSEGNFSELYKKEPAFKRYIDQSKIEINHE